MLLRREVARYWNVWGQTVLPPVISAALFLFIFGHALGARIGGFGDVPYIAFIAPGLALQGAVVNAYNNTASSLFDARRARYVQDVLTSPLTDAQVVLAYASAGVVRGVTIGLASLALAVPFAGGWDLDVAPFALLLVGASLGFALLGLVVGLHATRFDHIFAPITFLLTPLTFLGGMFYPVSALPQALADVSRFNPLWYLIDALRGATVGVHETSVWVVTAVVVLLDVALYAAVVRLFARSDRLRG